MTPPIDNKTVVEDAIELMHIKQTQQHRTFSTEEKEQVVRDVAKCADRAERRAKGER